MRYAIVVILWLAGLVGGTLAVVWLPPAAGTAVAGSVALGWGCTSAFVLNWRAS